MADQRLLISYFATSGPILMDLAAYSDLTVLVGDDLSFAETALLGVYACTRAGVTNSGAHVGVDANGVAWHFNLANATGDYWGQQVPITATVATPTGAITLPTIPTNWITADGIAANAIGASELAADAVTEIQSGLATATALATAQASLDDLPTNAELATALAAADDAVLAAVATRASQTSLDTLDDLVDTEVAAIKAKTDNLPSDPADQSAVEAAITAATSPLATASSLAALAGKFTGITLLAQWLGLIAGKQTGNTTARTELNATGAGSGTFDNTTDSLEAIRDRGDAAWITGAAGGSGARLVTITVDDGSTALQNATVRMSQGAESYSQTTNASGIATFSLDDATWTVTVTKALYTFTPTTIIVNGTETATYSMTATVITPSDPGETTGYLTIRNMAGTEVEGATVEVEVTRWASGTTGSGLSVRLVSGATDVNGLVEFVGLPRLATYRVRVDGGEWTLPAVTLDATTTPLLAPLGPLE